VLEAVLELEPLELPQAETTVMQIRAATSPEIP
jgi:hypothetical protein